MAGIDFDEYDRAFGAGERLTTRRVSFWINTAGAICSVALVLGAIWWGYKLAVRDVTGVPVMRAIESPMRIAPADPGGEVAGSQGLSVNAVAAAGTAAPLPDELILAPAPSSLAEEDAAGLAEAALTSAPLVLPGDDLPMLEGGYSSTAPLMAAEIPTADQGAVADAIAQALGSELEDAPAPGAAAALVSSLRPLARPAGLDTGVLAAADAATQAANAAVLSDPGAAPAEPATDGAEPVQMASADPANIAAGTRLVQLGAFDEDAAARSDWQRLSQRFPELMADKQLLVQPALSGGRTFYRLRAMGFADEGAARRFCTALLAENVTCIPVTQR